MGPGYSARKADAEYTFSTPKTGGNGSYVIFFETCNVTVNDTIYQKGLAIEISMG